jgi:hypothetical protein
VHFPVFQFPFPASILDICVSMLIYVHENRIQFVSRCWPGPFHCHHRILSFLFSIIIRYYYYYYHLDNNISYSAFQMGKWLVEGVEYACRMKESNQSNRIEESSNHRINRVTVVMMRTVVCWLHRSSCLPAVLFIRVFLISLPRTTTTKFKIKHQTTQTNYSLVLM